MTSLGFTARLYTVIARFKSPRSGLSRQRPKQGEAMAYFVFQTHIQAYTGTDNKRVFLT